MTFRPTYPLLLALFATSALALLQSCQSDNRPKGCPPVEFSTENTVNVRMVAAATVFNPLLGTAYSSYVSGQIFQTLGVVEPQTLEMQPLLAKSIPQVRKVTSGPFAGTLAYDFELWENAAWDNGSPITANDVIFSLKIIMHPLLPLGNWRGYFQYMEGVEADPANPKKFTVYFNRYYLLALETLCQFYIYPAYNYDPNNQLNSVPLADLLNAERAQELVSANPALAAWAEAFQSPRFANDKDAISGSGPYRLENLDVAQGCVLVKKKNWWGNQYVKQNPYLGAFPEKLVYRFIKEDAPAENLLRADGLDIIPDFSPAKFLALQQDSCLALRYDFSALGTTAYGRIMFNLNNPLLAEKAVRKALAHSVDYGYLLNTIYQGLAERIVGPINPAKSFYARNIRPYDYNIQRAKDLLGEAGWKDSNGNGTVDKVIGGTLTELELELQAPLSPTTKKIATSFQTTAKSAGIKINIVEKDIAIIREQTKKGEYQMAISSATLFPGQVDMYQTYHTKSIGADNRFNYSNPKLDALLDAIRTEPDDAKRNPLYLQAQQILYDDLPELYLLATKQRVIVSKRFQHVVSPNRPGYYEQYFRLLHQ